MESKIKSGKTYWIIKTCSNGTTCVTTPSRNITKSTPVTSLLTKETYISTDCAFCNNEELSDLVLWGMKKLCVTRSDLLVREDEEKLFKSTFKNPLVCNVGFNPPASGQNMVKTCPAYTHDAECDIKATNIMKSYLAKACRQYYLPYYAENAMYRNIFCAMCEFNAENLYIQYDIDNSKTSIDVMLPSFSALLDFETVDKEPTFNEMKCTANQIFDEKLVSYII
jgi:hypothetical protein